MPAVSCSGSRGDPQSRPGGRSNTSGRTAGLTADACTSGQITAVYAWLTRPDGDTSVTVLRADGYPLTADQVAGVVAAAERQTWRRLPHRPADGPLPRQPRRGHLGHPHQRRARPARSSTPRSSSAAAALTASPPKAAAPPAYWSPLPPSRSSTRPSTLPLSRPGRLPVPMSGVLNEAANMCRWREQPNLLASHSLNEGAHSGQQESRSCAPGLAGSPQA